MSNAESYPEHCRTSCSDAAPDNADAGGSSGCQRCTALVMDQAEKYRELLKCVKTNLEKGMSKSMQKLQARTIGEELNHV